MYVYYKINYVYIILYYTSDWNIIALTPQGITLPVTNNHPRLFCKRVHFTYNIIRI